MNNNKSLAELRGEKKMSQRDLARKLGVSSATNRVSMKMITYWLKSLWQRQNQKTQKEKLL